MLCIPAPFQLHPGILPCDPGGSIFGGWFEKSQKIRACSYYFSWNHWKDSCIYTYMCTWASLTAQLVENPPWFNSWVRKIHWRRYRLPTPVLLGFPCGSAGKESAGDLGSIPGLGRFPWRRERLPIPVFWPGEFHGLYSPWGGKELDTTE